MGELISLYVRGRPAPQGSKRLTATGGMVEQSPYLVGWAGGWKGGKARGRRIHGAVEVGVYSWYRDHAVTPDELIGGYLKGPISVSITFYLEPWHGPIDEPPDLDKLARATFDALTAARVWADDGRVVEAQLRKLHADEWHPAGAYMIIRKAETHEFITPVRSDRRARRRRYRVSSTALPGQRQTRRPSAAGRG